jgi:hypothetical protein
VPARTEQYVRAGSRNLKAELSSVRLRDLREIVINPSNEEKTQATRLYLFGQEACDYSKIQY